MFRYLILVLIFVSSVCDAHTVDGWWHTSTIDGPGHDFHDGAPDNVDSHPHSHPPAQNRPPTIIRHELVPFAPRSFESSANADTTPQDDSGAIGDTNADTTPQDDSGATGAATVDPVNPAPLVSLPRQVVITAEPLRITEYMLQDWSRPSGGGLPQWIELYNPNADPMSLDGYQFTHAYRRSANAPWVYVTASITGLTIPASDAALIANRSARRGRWGMSGVSKKDVWIIPYDKYRARLKNGWHLTDPNGRLVHRIGTAFREYPADAPSDWDPSLGQPGLPSHTSVGYRVSYQSSPSGDPNAAHFYGNQNDVGSPGFYEAAPAAPSLQRPKLTTTWGHLKQGK